VEQPEQGDRWQHADEHLVEVDNDCHQYERVGGHMMKLKPIELQQSEEEGRYQWHKPDSSVAGEEGKLPRLEGNEREGTAPHPVIIPRRLQPEHPPQYHKVSLGAEARTWEVRSHCSNRWREFGSPESKEEDEEMGARRQENGGVDPSGGFHPLYPLLA
jgi:hypothetical protein